MQRLVRMWNWRDQPASRRLKVECIDLMYLNVYVPKLQFVEGVVSFLRNHRGYRFAWSALLEPISQGFIAGLYRFAKDHGGPVVDFVKGQRKDDLAHEFPAEFDEPEGVLFVGRAQEKAPVFRTEKRRNPTTGATYPWIVRTTTMVNHFYIYAVDPNARRLTNPSPLAPTAEKWRRGSEKGEQGRGMAKPGVELIRPVRWK